MSVIFADIISLLSAAGTIAAVIVALFANKKATKQLTVALKMQEQNKNVELYQARKSCIEKIHDLVGSNNEVLDVKLLFPQYIYSKIDELRKTATELKVVREQVFVFSTALREVAPFNPDVMEYWNILNDFCANPNDGTPFENLEKSFNKTIEFYYEENCYKKNPDEYPKDGLDLIRRLMELDKRYKEEYSDLKSTMENYISDSIKSII